MRLHGLRATDETTLVPLNRVTEDKKDQPQRGFCFHCGKYGHYKAQCRRLWKELFYATRTNTAETNQAETQKLKCDTCGKMHKTENCWDGANAANDPRKEKREFAIPSNKISEQPVPTFSSQPKN